MTHTILLPTDYSTASKKTLEYSLSLYGPTDNKYLLVNTFYIPFAGDNVPLIMDEAERKKANKEFDKLLKNIRKTFPGERIDIESRFLLGEVADTIGKITEKEKIDLIVMNTHGSAGRSEILVGSNTSAVVREVKCPTLVIPQNTRFKRPAVIVLALDNSSDTQNHTLKPLIELAKKYRSEIMVLHVRDMKESDGNSLNKSDINRVLEGIRHSFYEVSDDDVSTGIERFVKEMDAQMLAVVAGKLNFFESIFHKSISKKLTLHTDIPLLVMHEK